MRVVVATDSFKGSLSSREVADTVEQGIRDCIPECDVIKVAIADGGEGTTAAIIENLGGEIVEIEVCDPLGRKILAQYAIIEESKTAIIELSSASGLPLLKIGERNPLVTSTFGTGEIVADAIRRGCRQFLIGIGGSATNDGGIGLLRALGFRFLDSNGMELIGGGEILEKIDDIDDSRALSELSECNFTVACDVTNPFYGEQGAAYIFAPQKGATPEMVEQLDRGLRNFARVIKEFSGVDIGEMEGAGAAGGVGGALKALLNATLVRGIDMVLDAIGFQQTIEECDLIITGEGKIDRQTTMGKAPSGVLAVANRSHIPTIAIGGSVEWCEELQNSAFTAIEAVTPEGMPLAEAIKAKTAKNNIRHTAKRIAEQHLTK